MGKPYLEEPVLVYDGIPGNDEVALGEWINVRNCRSYVVWTELVNAGSVDVSTNITPQIIGSVMPDGSGPEFRVNGLGANYAPGITQADRVYSNTGQADYSTASAIQIRTTDGDVNVDGHIRVWVARRYDVN